MDRKTGIVKKSEVKRFYGLAYMNEKFHFKENLGHKKFDCLNRHPTKPIGMEKFHIASKVLGH